MFVHKHIYIHIFLFYFFPNRRCTRITHESRSEEFPYRTSVGHREYLRYRDTYYYYRIVRVSARDDKSKKKPRRRKPENSHCVFEVSQIYTYYEPVTRTGKLCASACLPSDGRTDASWFPRNSRIGLLLKFQTSRECLGEVFYFLAFHDGIR